MMTQRNDWRKQMMKHKCGLYIGRFQPLHIGHTSIISKMLDECEQVIVAVGSAQESGTEYAIFEDAAAELIEAKKQVAEDIQTARGFGDLSENAEYDAAKEEQGILESKIAMIKGKIVDARIIDQTDINTDEVQILTKVRVLNLKTNQEKIYQLVTEGEANILEGKIATTTPIAKGLLGKKVGETAEVVVPAGKLQFKILEISI